MLEIIIQGRGGQGAQTAGNLLAKAFFSEGKDIQVFATYGGARRGTPVSSFIRVDDSPIRRRCDIEHPHAILCFDASLLDKKLLSGVNKDTVILVNSTLPVDQFHELADCQFFTIDAIAVSKEHGLGKFVNSSLLGAFTSILKAPDIEAMRQTIAESAPVKKEENVSACLDGYQRMQVRALI
jgi:2-oxoacid:acceptor oxidoreductase gamma subunit (pyruvate/2-ketoisovalerate family)